MPREPLGVRNALHILLENAHVCHLIGGHGYRECSGVRLCFVAMYAFLVTLSSGYSTSVGLIATVGVQ